MNKPYQISTPPTQAVILAGGRGTRLRPLTELYPKPMIEVGGKPFLEHLIVLLREQGFERLLLLLGYLPEVIQEYCQDGSRWGIQIEYAVTAVEDDTGRRLKQAADRLDPIFLLLYCDNYWPMQVDRMWERFTQANVPAMLTIYTNKDRYTKNSIRLDDDGYIVEYDKTATAQGLQGVEISYAILKNSVVEIIPEGNPNLEATVYPSLAQSRQLLAYVTDHRYYSIGSLPRLPLTEMFFSNRPTVFLDRDGVLNRKPPRAEYVRRWEEFQWLPGAKEALRLLNEAGYRVIIISNQAGIGRGKMTSEELAILHRELRRDVQNAGGRIDAIYYCPHDWNEGCNCRKPKPGLLYQAQRDFNLNLSRASFIGDDERDYEAADAAGCTGMLVSEDASVLTLVQRLLKCEPTRQLELIADDVDTQTYKTEMLLGE